MAFPITDMLMILNLSCLSLALPHRLKRKYLPAWPTSHHGWAGIIWSSTSTRLSYSSTPIEPPHFNNFQSPLVVQQWLPTPTYLHDIIQVYTPARPLHSAATGRLAHPAIRAIGSRLSRLRSFSTLAPQWWNYLPIPIRIAPSLPIFHRSLKTHLFLCRSPLIYCLFSPVYP